MVSALRLLLGTVLRLFRARRALLLENLALRQQLVALRRRRPRPRLAAFDRVFWILAHRFWSGWKQLLNSTARCESLLRPFPPYMGCCREIFAPWRRIRWFNSRFVYKRSREEITKSTDFCARNEILAGWSAVLYSLQPEACLLHSRKRVSPDAVVQRAMRHTTPETKRHYQLGMTDQVRQAVEKANRKAYGRGRVLHFRDSPPHLTKKGEKVACN
jgi:hypothetical protein